MAVEHTNLSISNSASAEGLVDEGGSGGWSAEAGEQYRNGAVPFATRRATSSSSWEEQLIHASACHVAEGMLPSHDGSSGRSSRGSLQAELLTADTMEGPSGYEQVGWAVPISGGSMDDDSTSRVMRKALKLRQQRDGLADGARRGADGAAAQPQRLEQQQQQRQFGMRCSTYALEAVDAASMCAVSDVACHRCVLCCAPASPTQLPHRLHMLSASP